MSNAHPRRKASDSSHLRLWRQVRVPVLRVIIGIAFLATWELASGRLVREVFLSKPSKIVTLLWEITADGTAWFHLERTAQEFGIGYVIGAMVAIFVGTVLGRSDFLAALFEPYLIAFYSIPKISLAPLFVIWFGIGVESKVAVVALSSFFMTFVNTFNGMKNINEDYVSIVRIMGAKPRHVFWRVLLPAAAPSIILGLRSAVPYAIIGAIIGEMIASNRGLGFYIVQAAGYLNTTALFAGLTILVSLVMVVNMMLSFAERRILVWKPTKEQLVMGT
jgi:NitT/TauT family transport system permease protein